MQDWKFSSKSFSVKDKRITVEFWNYREDSDKTSVWFQPLADSISCIRVTESEDKNRTIVSFHANEHKGITYCHIVLPKEVVKVLKEKESD